MSDLLDLARLDSHTFSLHPVERDLRITLVEAVRASVPSAERQGIALTVDDGGAVPVVADEASVRQLLGNLLENATKYASATVEVHAAGEDAVVLVDDDGAGIAVEDRPHVFDVLYVSRLRPARSEAGSGLGLAIVRQLAEAMGGSVPRRLVTLRRGPHGGALAARLGTGVDVGDHTPLTHEGGERTKRPPPPRTGMTDGSSYAGGTSSGGPISGSWRGFARRSSLPA